MASAYQTQLQRPREWRRKVSIRARVRAGDDWADGHILNISSRGMLLQYARPLSVGSEIEIRQEGRKVPATVIWRDGFRNGLACHHPLDLGDWVAASNEQAGGLGLVCVGRAQPRQRRKRDEEDWRIAARKLEQVAIAAIAAGLAMSVAALAALALFRPLAGALEVLG